MLYAIARSAFGEALRAPEPASRVAGPTTHSEIDPGPECTARGTRQVASVLMCAMCPLHAFQVIVVAAQHVGRDGQMLQILRAEGTRPVSPRERAEGPCPRPTRHGFAALLDCVGYGHDLQ